MTVPQTESSTWVGHSHPSIRGAGTSSEI